ncbi:M48 family metalloprotease [Sphingomonas qilianensis]|uniref:M48 family metalloprotease n=1 Tax=Sphingomonas qilianensis TaxID=1736690 RepID=A0ABU9XT59_9SPHN
MYLPFQTRSGVVARRLGVLLVLVFSFISAGAAGSPLDRFARLQDQDRRVARVAYRLATADRALCPMALTPQLGFVLHALDQYAPADRSAAAQRFGLGQQIGVMAVIDGSPAQQAGLVAGDQLVAINGRALPAGMGGAARTPSRARVDQVQRLLVEEMQRGAVTLAVSGARGARTLHFAPDYGCAASIELIPGTMTNAWADGSRILIGAGLLQRCASDADLALIIAHEMAHNLLRHRQRLAAFRAADDAGTPISAAELQQSRIAEEQADLWAVRLTAIAGYDMSGAAAFMAGLLGTAPTAVTTHPAAARRLALLRAALAAQGVGADGAGRGRIANTASSGLVSGRM